MDPDRSTSVGLERRAAVHAALAEPTRLAIVDELASSDRSPTELAHHLGIGSNLLSHHLDVLADVGLVVRTSSAGDRRRKYVRLDQALALRFGIRGRGPRGRVLFLCSQNSARSQLAAALWSARTGRAASSAGTAPAERVHPSAVAAARRAGLSLRDATPRLLTRVPAGAQVVTVCDLAHEELTPTADWWHWSIPDPVAAGSDGAFDAVVAELEQRIAAVAAAPTDRTKESPRS